MFVALITFVLVLLVLVLVHEFGHFITARFFGVQVDEFGFGFPPRIKGIQRGKTLYSFNALPLGGFVKLKGEGGEDSLDADSFAHKKPWQRFIILIAGVVMNVLLAISIFSFLFMVGIPQELPDGVHTADERVSIIEVAKGSPAEKAGLKLGDSLLSIDGQSVVDPAVVTENVKENPESSREVVIVRGTEHITYSVTPAVFGTNDRPLLGVGMLRTGTMRYGILESIGRGMEMTAMMTWLILSALGGLLLTLLQGGSVAGDLSGPIGVAVMSGTVARMGWVYVLNFTALLSVNLALLNVLPFPALDGGRVLFVIIEKIRGTPVNQRIERMAHTIGFALLILLVLTVTYHDIAQYGQNIFHSLRSMLP